MCYDTHGAIQGIPRCDNSHFSFSSLFPLISYTPGSFSSLITSSLVTSSLLFSYSRFSFNLLSSNYIFNHRFSYLRSSVTPTPVIVQGPAAAAEATAKTVFADILRLGRELGAKDGGPMTLPVTPFLSPALEASVDPAGAVDSLAL